MNRIDKKFQELRDQGATAFMPYLCAGDPNPELTSKLLLTLEEAGADLIELGVPFSDPIADGPTVQRASERALTHHISLQEILEMVATVRTQTDIPIALMSYYNPIFRMGEDAFCQVAQDAGVDGVIVPDLPPEQAQSLLEIAPRYNLATIFLVAPTSPPERMQLIASVSTGFIYCVSVTGVTGARAMLSDEIAPMIAELRKHTDKPISVGFGVSTPDQATQIAQIADGVIVGSAIINVVEEHINDEARLFTAVKQFASDLTAGVKR
ncbi:Tryptophan synthase alpha chain [Geodia barretti]|uniref:tryptophan synthase n=3 Tax=Geodia barretti TaxID=519541 RepID=A0AA35X4G4_GEOBA|nr:Tryptophan synthase alpha chain [Geodia barretti]